MKKKNLFLRLLPWIILAALLACLVIFVGIPLYGPKPASALEAPTVMYYEGASTPYVLENDSLRFEMDPKTTKFSLTDKATGQVWYSNPVDANTDTIAVSTNKAMLQSTLVVTYSSSDGTIDFNNYQYSIENGTYRIEQTDDAVIVTYAVGKIEKVYRIPTAIRAEDYAALIANLSKSAAKRVDGVYTNYKPEKVAAMDADKRDELLALYPVLEDTELYVLKSDTSANNKAKMEEFFTEAGYTDEAYARDMELVAGAREKKDAVFNVTVRYKLDGGDFLVEVPYSEIRYRAEFPITYVTVLPMFGAAGQEVKGSMLIPEGGGALIRYNNGKLSQNAYYANLYGWDYGSERREVVSETKNNFPVFGMIREGEGSFLCFIEGCQSYAGIQADIAMRNNSYNWMCAKYNVLHSDRYNVSAKTARLVYMFESEIPDDTIVQRYRFTDTDDVNALAGIYGDYLREIHPELAEAELNPSMPVSVDLLGAIDKQVVKFGMPVKSVVSTTSFSEARQILTTLQKAGIQNLSIRFSGWANGGVSQKVLSKVKVERVIGGEDGMKQLIVAAKSKNIPLYFDGVTCFAYRSGMLEGFIPFRDAARFTTREQIKIYPYSVVYYQSDKNQDPYYLVQPRYALDKVNNLLSALQKAEAYGVAFRDIGSLLSADYNPKDNVTREEVKQMNIETVKKAKAMGQHVMVKEGNDYIIPYVDLITDMELNGINYSIIDEQIPFYQMAIHGAVAYTGKPLTTTSDYQEELLRCAEYGAGLNFTFMQEEGSVLQDTVYSGYYGASFENASQTALDAIARYQTDMAGLNAIRMTGHETVAENVTATYYENGTCVLVNYGTAPAEVDGHTVAARDYLVVRGDV